MTGIYQTLNMMICHRSSMFPLPSALLLGGHLPLNIFEPRYLAMVDAALASPDRLIGMVQPTEDDKIVTTKPTGSRVIFNWLCWADHLFSGNSRPALFDCAGWC